MTWNMLIDEEVRHLSVPERLFSYADAYAAAAKALCLQMTQVPSTASWANGAVVLMLAAHATELFLKGAILTRHPNENVWRRGHDLQKLHEDYSLAFPEPEFRIEVVFNVTLPPGISAEDAADLMARTPKPSVLYRYPVGNRGQDWIGHFGFEPNSFLRLLAVVENDCVRVRALLNNRSH